jgi:hypothetical protein
VLQIVNYHFLGILPQDFVYNIALKDILVKIKQQHADNSAYLEAMQIRQPIAVLHNVRKFKTYSNLEIGLAYLHVHLDIMQIQIRLHVYKFAIQQMVCMLILKITLV